MEKIIIDGNNLMHKIPHIKDSREAVVEAVRSRTAKNVIFVFDGHGDDSSNVRFSGSQTADALIRQYVEENSGNTELTVVSSDNGITDLAKICACRVIKSEEFWNSLSANDGVTPDKNVNQVYQYNEDDEKPSGLSKKDLKEFRKYFT
jgi:predicted RNA-binding protein with PIN domain